MKDPEYIKMKVALYRRLLIMDPQDLADNEVEIMFQLSQDKDIQAVLERATKHYES